MLEHPDITCALATGYSRQEISYIIGYCKSCGGEIVKGEPYYTDGYYKFHEDCIELREE